MKNILLLALIITTAEFCFSQGHEYLTITKIAKDGIMVEYNTNKEQDFSCLFKDKKFLIESMTDESPFAVGDVLDGKIKCVSPLNNGNTVCAFYGKNLKNNLEYRVYSSEIERINVWNICKTE